VSIRRLPSGPWAVGMIAGVITAVIGGLIVALIMGTGSSGRIITSPSPSRTSTSAPSPTAPTPEPSATASSSAPLRYMSVPLAALCAPGGGESNEFDSCTLGDGITQMGSQPFSYAAISPVYNNLPEAMTFPKTTCQSLTLEFGFSPSEDNTVPGLTNTVSVTQNNLSPKQATVSSNQLGKLTVKLNGGPWVIDTAANVPAPGGNWALFLNGSARCSTNNGRYGS
jgi:energy-converting hydrogenase Eha subunit A